MNKSIKFCFLIFLIAFTTLIISGNIYGQKAVFTDEKSLMVNENIFGGSYEYLSGEIIISDQAISDEANVSYKSGQLIKLTTGFKVERNCRFKAKIAKNNEVVKIHEEAENPNIFEVFPNVSKAVFTIRINAVEDNNSFRIYNTSGILIHSFTQLKPGVTEVNLSEYPKGVYFIKAEIEDNSYLKKIVLQ
jgi:hypothetical protein